MATEDPARRRLDAAAIAADVVAPGRTWREVRVVEQTASTNADVAAAARAGHPEGLVLAAERQVAGRGRLDREWSSPPGAGLAVSMLLRPDTVPAARWVWLPLLVGLAVDATARDCGVPTGLKWPNDVLVEDRKLAGILLERVDSPAGPAAVVGVGLNVSMRAEERPVPTATSLVLEGAEQVDRGAVLVLLLGHLERLLERWRRAGGDPDASGVGAAYRDRCTTLGTEVRVLLPDGSDLRGRAEDVDGWGRLVVAGTPVSAGDITHVRPDHP